MRPLSRYNGWRETGASRGGHIPGAVALPASWLPRLDDAELELMLDEKGITASTEVVVYGDDMGAAPAGAASPLGHLPVRTYAAWAEWTEDENLPLERLARYEQLVDSDWLSELLDGGGPESAPSGQSPPVSRQLRGPGGVRRQPPGKGSLPGHQPAREPAGLESTLTRGSRRRTPLTRYHDRHHRHSLRPRHRRRGQRKVAGTPRRPDRREPGGTHPLLLRRR